MFLIETYQDISADNTGKIGLDAGVNYEVLNSRQVVCFIYFSPNSCIIGSSYQSVIGCC